MLTEPFPGFSIEDCDEMVLLLIEAQGLLPRWKKMKSTETDRILIYDNPHDERMIFMEHTGVPGDEGLVAWIIKKEVLNHPIVDRAIRYAEALREVSLDNKPDGTKHYPPNN